jgi:hypothetical protein
MRRFSAACLEHAILQVVSEQKGEGMAIVFVLVMKKHESPTHWMISAHGPLEQLKKLVCYSDPPMGALPKTMYHSIGQLSVSVRRCADMNEADEGTIYELQNF